MAKTPGEWIHERTLGGHRREFWWRLDAAGSLVILARRKSGGRMGSMVRAFARDELEQLLAFMADGDWHRLACSPNAMGAGAREDGIGVFVHRALGRSKMDASLAAQIAAVLTQAGLWVSDGRRCAMQFRQVASDLGKLCASYQTRREAAGPQPPRVPTRTKGHPARPTSQPPGFDRAESFQGTAAALRGELRAVGGGRHTPSIGRRREGVFRSFLRRYLPGRYAIGGGEVAEPSGAISRQVDILVYDALDQEPLTDDREALVLPAESVYTAIEVKPRLNGDQLLDAADIVRSVKVLPRSALDRAVVRDGRRAPQANPPPFGAILACHSTDPDQLAQRLRAVQDGKPPPLWVDAVCILDTAVIHRFTGMPGPVGWTLDCYEGAVHYAVVDTGEDSLLYFLDLLRADLRQKRLWPYDLASYSRGITFDEPRIL